MKAAAATVLLATEIAAIVMMAGVAALAGDVYVTATPERLDAGDTVPQVEPPHADPPSSVHVTPLFCESFCSVAIKFCVTPPVGTLTVIGEIDIIIAGVAVIVMPAVVDLVVSAREVAVRITIAGEGTVEGAV